MGAVALTPNPLSGPVNRNICLRRAELNSRAPSQRRSIFTFSSVDKFASARYVFTGQIEQWPAAETTQPPLLLVVLFSPIDCDNLSTPIAPHRVYITRCLCKIPLYTVSNIF